LLLLLLLLLLYLLGGGGLGAGLADGLAQHGHAIPDLPIRLAYSASRMAPFSV
jgi:hypothetical protein